MEFNTWRGISRMPPRVDKSAPTGLTTFRWQLAASGGGGRGTWGTAPDPSQVAAAPCIPAFLPFTWKRSDHYYSVSYNRWWEPGIRWHLPVLPTTLAKLESISATTLTRLLLRSQHRCKEVSSATHSGKTQGKGMPLHFRVLIEAWRSTTGVWVMLLISLIGTFWWNF
jgi:hypothetical protein